MPPGTEHVSEIASFGNINGVDDISAATITLTDGRTLTGIDQVIFSTGYVIP
jgi:hypothetical protein